ncbi:MAG: adenylate/guanylate cyclase domain-containing protein, partial [SAR324 cluster bacterium]|nr:adenylate/guanylate cyclase domain-containing protein [SAR324 cluster bacterium]
MASKGSKANKGTQRKLTAILCADVVGYSRLMGDDEEATIEILTAYRKVFTSKIKKHRGRVVDAKGDAILAEFAAVTDSVSCAVEIQQGLAERNIKLADNRRMDFRIGVNLGEVMVKGEEIYGDGINVAARLESLAEPGGICISRNVYDQVKNKLKLEYEYLGEQQVKNIAEPVRAYNVNFTQSDDDKKVEQPVPISADSLIPGGISLELPDRPSIAVLAFENMSSDPDQEYFSDGITEDIITDLSKISNLFVIARNASFTYKGRSVNPKQVAGELGVRFVLEGSVRKAGSRVRITAQLIEAATDSHLWAERYDRELEDVFAVQDDITFEIVTALDVKLVKGEQ